MDPDPLGQAERIGAGPIDPEANERNREIFNEFLEVVLKAWKDSFNHNGKHYQTPYPASGIPVGQLPSGPVNSAATGRSTRPGRSTESA